MSGTIAAFLPSFPAFARTEWNPSFDVTENKDGYVFKAGIPGVKKEDLEITIKDGVLTLVIPAPG